MSSDEGFPSRTEVRWPDRDQVMAYKEGYLQDGGTRTVRISLEASLTFGFMVKCFNNWIVIGFFLNKLVSHSGQLEDF